VSHMFDARREHARLAHEGSLTMQAVTHPLECVGGAAMRTAHETEHRPTLERTDRLWPARLFSGATAAERSTRVLSRREAEHRDFCQAKAMLAAHVRPPLCPHRRILGGAASRAPTLQLGIARASLWTGGSL
jgi:hypothetical protein